MSYQTNLIERFKKLKIHLRDWCDDGDITTNKVLEECSEQELEYAVECLEEMSFEDTTFDFPGWNGYYNIFIDVIKRDFIIERVEENSSTGGSLFGGDDGC